MSKNEMNKAKSKINARVEKIKLSDLVFLDKNARYMEPQQWRRLVENIKQDGVLTSAPLVCRAGNSPLTSFGKKNPDALEIISGNHRAKAAIEAGIEYSDVIIIDDESVSKAKKIAMQLAHNEISGKDDASILRELYDDLDFDFKIYSGVDEAKFKIDDLDLKSLGSISADMQEVSIFFIPKDADLFINTLKRIEKKSGSLHLVAAREDFNLFFDSVVSFKKYANIHNTATAVAKMCEIVNDFIRSAETENAGDLPCIKAESLT